VGSEICPHLTSLKIIFRIGMMGKNSSLVHANIKLCRLMHKYSPVLSYNLFAFFVFVYFLCDVICLYMILFAFYILLFAFICALICFLYALICFYMLWFAFDVLVLAFYVFIFDLSVLACFNKSCICSYRCHSRF
jgi:hypothetical protein